MDGEGEILKAILTLHEATEMRFNTLDAKFAALDARFAAQDARFAAQDTRLDRFERDVHAEFDNMRDELASNNLRLDRLDRDMRDGFGSVNQRLDRLERHRRSH